MLLYLRLQKSSKFVSFWLTWKEHVETCKILHKKIMIFFSLENYKTRIGRLARIHVQMMLCGGANKWDSTEKNRLLWTCVCVWTNRQPYASPNTHIQHYARIHTNTYTCMNEHSITWEWYEFNVIYTNLMGHIYKYNFAKLLNYYQSFGCTRR